MFCKIVVFMQFHVIFSHKHARQNGDLNGSLKSSIKVRYHLEASELSYLQSKAPCTYPSRVLYIVGRYMSYIIFVVETPLMLKILLSFLIYKV